MQTMRIRKAVILAGGTGSRLQPLTSATNKHLLPLYDKPVIYHAVDRLVAAGISRIMIVTGAQHLDDFARVLGSGEHWIPKDGNGKQIQITYGIQNKPSGIADGLYIAKEYIAGEPCLLYLGDNYIEDDLEPYLSTFEKGAYVFLKEVTDPERFGVAEIASDGTVLSLEEKPVAPKSNKAVVGLYLYDETVFDKMVGMEPSARGEYEITYVNNQYLAEGTLKAAMLTKPWYDIGTFDSLLEASNHVRETHGEAGA
jgi:glucose-1-phosphate thymidylyltransferase